MTPRPSRPRHSRSILTVRGWRNGFRRQDAVLLGVALGLVGLHKANGLVVAPMAGGLIAWKLRHSLPQLLQDPRHGRPTGAGRGRLVVCAHAGCVWRSAWHGHHESGDRGRGYGCRHAAMTKDLSPWEFAVANRGWIEGAFRSFWAGYAVGQDDNPRRGLPRPCWQCWASARAG